MERLDKNFLLHAYQPELYSLSKLSFPRFHRSLQYSHPISNEIFIRTSIVRSASKRRVIIKPRRASCIPSPQGRGEKKTFKFKELPFEHEYEGREWNISNGKKARSEKRGGCGATTKRGGEEEGEKRNESKHARTVNPPLAHSAHGLEKLSSNPSIHPILGIIIQIVRIARERLI